MTKQSYERNYLAALNAAEMIRGHVEVGISPEDVCETDKQGLREYHKACKRVASKLETLANKYKQKADRLK